MFHAIRPGAARAAREWLRWRGLRRGSLPFRRGGLGGGHLRCRGVSRGGEGGAVTNGPTWRLAVSGRLVSRQISLERRKCGCRIPDSAITWNGCRPARGCHTALRGRWWTVFRSGAWAAPARAGRVRVGEGTGRRDAAGGASGLGCGWLASRECAGLARSGPAARRRSHLLRSVGEHGVLFASAYQDETGAKTTGKYAMCRKSSRSWVPRAAAPAAWGSWREPDHAAARAGRPALTRPGEKSCDSLRQVR